MNSIVKAALFTAADDILDSFGLARRDATSAVLPALGCFAAGVVVGGCAALMLAPMTGEQMVDKLSAGVDTVRDKLQEAKKRAETQTKSAKNGLSHAHGDTASAGE